MTKHPELETAWPHAKSDLLDLAVARTHGAAATESRYQRIIRILSGVDITDELLRDLLAEYESEKDRRP